jgi:hypothetical protein
MIVAGVDGGHRELDDVADYASARSSAGRQMALHAGAAPTQDDLRRARTTASAIGSNGCSTRTVREGTRTDDLLQHDEERIHRVYLVDGRRMRARRVGNPQQGWAAVRQTLYEIRRLLQGIAARQP